MKPISRQTDSGSEEAYGTATLRSPKRSRSIVRVAKRGLRTIATPAMHHLGLWRLYRLFRRGMLAKKEVCILAFHRVLSEDDWHHTNSFRSIVVRERTFAEFLKYLRETFQIFSVGGFLGGEPNRATSSRPMCVVTFDDGWLDNYTTAFPLLKEYEIPATIFLVTDLVESGKRFWVERVNEAWNDPDKRRMILQATTHESGANADLVQAVEYLKHMSMAERNRLLGTFLPDEQGQLDGLDRNMTWNQAAEMSRNGIDFGGHTVNHPLLTFEDSETVRRELQDAKIAIETKLGIKARSFCYPNGDWNNRVRETAQEVGYECAFSVRPGWHCLGDNLFTIRRILLSDGSVTNDRGEFSPAVFDMTLGRG